MNQRLSQGHVDPAEVSTDLNINQEIYASTKALLESVARYLPPLPRGGGKSGGRCSQSAAFRCIGLTSIQYCSTSSRSSLRPFSRRRSPRT